MIQQRVDYIWKWKSIKIELEFALFFINGSKNVCLCQGAVAYMRANAQSVYKYKSVKSGWQSRFDSEVAVTLKFK